MVISSARGRRTAVLLSLLFVQIFFGLHYAAAKLLLRQMPPFVYAAIRVAAAAVLLLAVTRLLARPLPSRADTWRLALYAVFGVIINQVCFVEGLHRTTTTHSALINTIIPIETLLFAALLGRERMSVRKVASILMSLAGVLLVIQPGGGSAPTSLAGNLLSLANASSYAIFLVIGKRVMTRTDPLAATAVLMAFGAIGILVLGAPQLLAFDFGAVSAGGWGIMALVVLLPTAGAYLLNNWALARTDASVVALFIYLQPILAAGLGIAMLGERPGAHVFAGGLLIFGGVFVALRPAGHREADP